MALSLIFAATLGVVDKPPVIDWTKVQVTAVQPPKKTQAKKRPVAIPSTEVARLVAAEFGTSSVMYRIAACESTGSVSGVPRHFGPDGNVLRGKINPKDVGVFQINEFYHQADALKAGIDIHTVEGNIKWARKLYERNGTRDWNWSKHCWG